MLFRSGQVLGDGGRYDPTTDVWAGLVPDGAPSARQAHTAVWTGSEMILWGGVGEAGDLQDGGRYQPP